MLEPPSAVEGLNVIPLAASPHVVHSRYWEAKEFLSFVLRQVLLTRFLIAMLLLAFANNLY